MKLQIVFKYVVKSSFSITLWSWEDFEIAEFTVGKLLLVLKKIVLILPLSFWLKENRLLNVTYCICRAVCHNPDPVP